MSTAAWINQLESNSVADKAAKAAARLWVLVAIIGQWAFLYYIVAFSDAHVAVLSEALDEAANCTSTPRFKTKIAAKQISSSEGLIRYSGGTHGTPYWC